MRLLRLDDFLNVLDVLLKVIQLFESGALFRRQVACQLPEKVGELLPARVGAHEYGKIIFVFPEQGGDLHEAGDPEISNYRGDQGRRDVDAIEYVADVVKYAR